MDLNELIRHPELLNKDTLYDLRSLVALYPYYQPARILMLQNLYLLHDPTFDEELRRAAVYITDRRTIFNLVEAMHYKLKRPKVQVQQGDRTVSLIDDFLSSIPEEDETKDSTPKKEKRKPTAADAAVDYVAYLMATDFEDTNVGEMKGQSLIDNFINNEGGRIQLKDNIEFSPESEATDENGDKLPEEEFFTETLAGIYIKQGRYLKALEIIKRLNLEYPKKNAYFADQIRFLEKLIVNSTAMEEAKKRNNKQNNNK